MEAPGGARGITGIIMQPDFRTRHRPLTIAAEPDREFASKLGSAAWSTPAARAAALLQLHDARLGTYRTDRLEWCQAVVLGTIQRVLPLALDAAGRPEHAAACRAAFDLVSAWSAAQEAATSFVDHEGYAYAGYAAGYATTAAGYAATASADSPIEQLSTAVANAGNTAAYAAGYAPLDEVLLVAVRVALDAYAASPRFRTARVVAPRLAAERHIGDDAVARITRYRLYSEPGMIQGPHAAWYWAYNLHSSSGEVYNMGRMHLSTVRETAACGAATVIEDWSGKTWRRGPRGGLTRVVSP